MLPQVQFESQSEVPLYRQLYKQIAEAIRHGNLANGDRLPPTRELAGQLGLNRTTVSAAYSLLEEDGLIRGHVGRGSFVQYTAAAADRISFESSRPADDHFPMADFQACCREIISSPEIASVLQLGAPAGYQPLRRLLLEAALEEGSATEGDDILITSGCQQALDLIGRVLVRPGDPVAVEDPVYHGLKNVFGRAGARLLGVRMGADGLDLDQLATLLASSRAKLLAVTPNFQNPTGATMSIEARRALLALARRHEVIVVENDIYGELRYEGSPLPTLKSLDPGASVILLRSFSKIAFPGLRVGSIIAPRAVIAELTDVRQWCDLHTDQLSQAILWRFAESGRLQSHLTAVRAAGKNRLIAALRACRCHLPAGSEFTKPEGGMNLWVRLPRELDAAEMLSRAQREGVSYVPGRHFAVADPAASSLRISFGGLAPERIETGMAILGRVAKESLEGASATRWESASALV